MEFQISDFHILTYRVATFVVQHFQYGKTYYKMELMTIGTKRHVITPSPFMWQITECKAQC